MSFYHQPHPWNPGYAIPKYVLAEPPGRGTFTTKWLPRGTISDVVPDFLAEPVGDFDLKAAFSDPAVKCKAMAKAATIAEKVTGVKVTTAAMQKCLEEEQAKKRTARLVLLGAGAVAVYFLFLRK